MSASDVVESAVLRALFGRTPLSPPPIYYMGLSSTEINEDGTGKTEPTDPSYARVPFANEENSFTHSAGQVQNGTIIQFPTASDTWNANYWFMSDHLTNAGTIHFKGSINPSQTVTVNQQLRFPVGGLTITMT